MKLSFDEVCAALLLVSVTVGFVTLLIAVARDLRRIETLERRATAVKRPLPIRRTLKR